jgi:gluconate 2-dehydrogenase alpha chain
MTVQNRVDVVTVGAGWTAAILAWKLTAAGLRVLSLEQGPVRTTVPHFEHNHDHLSHSVRLAMKVDLRRETWTWRPNPRAPSLPIRKHGAFHPGQGLGGAGVHWATQHWRFYPTDFEYRSHHIERYGEDKLPQGSRIQDWGLTYAELEPYFDAVDYDIGVSGVAGNLRGEIQEEGNPFEGARSRPYPLPPTERSIAAGMFSAACEELGHHPFRQPGAILSRAYTGLSGHARSGCLYCGHCVRFGCEVDAKASPITDHIPLAVATGLYEVRHHCHVTRVNIGPAGLATGVTYIDLATGEEHVQPADIVILSAWPLTNVRLMLLSRNDAHPDGIGNDRGMVGQNLTYQLSQSPVTGIFEDRQLNTYMGHSLLQDVIHDFNADNFDHSDLDFLGGASITAGGGERDPLTSTLNMPGLHAGEGENGNDDEEDEPPQHPPLFNQVHSLAGQGDEWGEDWKENLGRNWDGIVSIGIQGESLPYDDQFMDLDPNYRDAFGEPLLRITFDWQPNDYNLYRFMAERCEEIMEAMEPDRMTVTEELGPFEIHPYQSTHITGGAIMGVDPSNSVTNRYGQVWDTPNVFVTGATLYPQNPGMNPTGPLLALAYLAGDGIRERYLRNEGRTID